MFAYYQSATLSFPFSKVLPLLGAPCFKSQSFLSYVLSFTRFSLALEAAFRNLANHCEVSEPAPDFEKRNTPLGDIVATKTK